MRGMSYNFGTVIRGRSQTGVRQRLDKGWIEVGQELDRSRREVQIREYLIEIEEYSVTK